MDINKIKAFLSQNKNYVAVAVVFVGLIVILMIASSSDTKEKENAGDIGTDQTEEVINVEETAQEPETEAEAATNELLTDAYPEVNELIRKYFDAMSSADIDTLLQIVNTLSEEEQNQIAQKKEYIESYNNVVCYSKIGPVEKSYIVFAYYEIKFINIDTLVPGLVPLYVCTNEDNSLYIYNGDLDPEVDSYISNVAGEQDVINLLDTVEKKYEEAQNSDEALKKFVARLSGQTVEENTQTAENDAKQDETDTTEGENAENETPQENTESETPQETAESEASQETVYAKETINVRAGADTETEKLGQIYAGDSITRTEVLDSGWSKILYDGHEGYVKSEYLTYDQISQETLYLTSSVNIRAEASEDAGKLGTGFVGTKVTRLWKLDNGWSQITCDGITGYVKSEFLSKTYQ